MKNLLRAALPFLAITIGAVTLSAATVPAPASDEPKTTSQVSETAVLAGGCFWGMEGVFEHVKGVTNVVSGFAGGQANTAHYDDVSTGSTGHAESIKITYDPAQITYGQILMVYFGVAHDPTEMNRQGPDSGSQYRSAIFYANNEQKRVADAYIKQLDDAHVYKHKIVTQLTPLKGFYPAEAYHQHYMQLHPDAPYILYNDMPKLKALRKEYPEICKR